MKTRHKKSAFTLIELLVVVAIIGLLAATILASLGGVRESASATRMAQDLRQMETAFNAWALSEGYVEWPSMFSFNTSQVPPVQHIADTTDFGEYLSSVPDPFYGSEYLYYQFGQHNACTSFSGTSIYVGDVSREDAVALDNVIDGGEAEDLDCGKVRWFNTVLYYKLSNQNGSNNI